MNNKAIGKSNASAAIDQSAGYGGLVHSIEPYRRNVIDTLHDKGDYSVASLAEAMVEFWATIGRG
jgi:hypothetical protein